MNPLISDGPSQLAGPVRIEKSFARYLSWFGEYGNYLWTLALFPDWNKEEIAFDFQEISLHIRRRFLQDPTLDSYDALLLFWNQWNKRFAQRSKRKQASNLSIPLMLFAFGWPLSRVARITGWGLSRIRFVTLETLRSLQKNPISPLSLSRDCLRSDLFIVEYLPQETWNDAFQVFGPKQLATHLGKCPRCSKQLTLLKESASLFKNVRLEAVPQHIESAASKVNLPTTQTEFIKFQYRLLGFFPKLILQSSIIAIVLFSLLNMPFIGDFNVSQMKPLTRSFKSAWTWSRESFTFTTSKVQTYFATKENAPTPPTPVAIQDSLQNSSGPSSEMAQVSPLENFAQSSKLQVAASTAPINSSAKIEAQATRPGETIAKVPTVKALKSAKAERIFLRWGSFTDDLDGFTPKILEILSQYQAEKAGDLELGAEYRGGRYFHFRISEEHKELLKRDIQNLKMKNFYVDTAPSSRDEIPGKVRIVFLVRTPRNQ